jgi:hypothetical protein
MASIQMERHRMVMLWHERLIEIGDRGQLKIICADLTDK